MTSRSLGHRAPLLWLVVPLISGLALGRLWQPLPIAWQLGFALAAAAIAVFSAWRDGRLWMPALVIAMLFAGSASYGLHRARLPEWDALPPREARLELRLDRVFAQPDARKVSGLATIVGADTHLRELAGQRIYFSLALRKAEAAPLRSSVVSAVGVLVTLPQTPPGDSFDSYLAGAGVNFRLTRGRVVATTQPASAYYAFCQRMAQRFATILATGVDEKQPQLAAVLRAMLLGQKHELSDEQDALFMRSGTMHLFAISGLHIGVIAVGLNALLALFRVPSLLRFAGSVGALWLYVEITGGTPSAVRAFLMVALVQASVVLRAPGNPVAALALSAFIVALVWPLQVFSASFQMSYGIVAALLLLGLPLAEAWSERGRLFASLPQPAWRWHHHAIEAGRRKIVGALAIGVASTLVSTLSGILFFKLFTPAALLANLVLIPAATLVILGGFSSLVSGLVGLTALSSLFNHAAGVILFAIDSSVRAVVTVPGAWRPAEFAAAWIGPVALAALFAALALGYSARWQSARGSWWPPLAIVALTLIFGVKYG